MVDPKLSRHLDEAMDIAKRNPAVREPLEKFFVAALDFEKVAKIARPKKGLERLEVMRQSHVAELSMKLLACAAHLKGFGINLLAYHPIDLAEAVVERVSNLKR